MVWVWLMVIVACSTGHGGVADGVFYPMPYQIALSTIYTAMVRCVMSIIVCDVHS